MKHILFLIIFLFVSRGLFGQITFEKGYFIDNSENKTTVLIKNIDWKNNPTYFKYKTTASGDINNKNIADIKEFSIDNGSKYIRATVNINRSSNKVPELDGLREVNFNEEQLFLKELVSGSANLYVYENGNLMRFFYSINNEVPIQLVYKRYKKENIQIAENNEYRQQLLNVLLCENVSTASIKNISYTEKSLKRIFDIFNSCNDPINYVASTSNNKLIFRIRIRPRLNNTTLDVNSTADRRLKTNFDKNISLAIGAEIEAVLPFNKNKWAILIEPTYQNYSAETEPQKSNNFSANVYNAEVQYTSIELPIGLRHYIFLSDKSKIFLNASLLIDIPFNSQVVYNGLNRPNPELSLNTSLALGFGVDIFEKLSIEARYLGKREVFASTTDDDFTSNYRGFSIILGYTLF